jgi:Domain of unknown function (DUF4124)
MQRTLAIATLILAAGVGAALADGDIWRWKDAQGVFHYSDQWVPGSELIKSNSNRPRPADDPSANRSVPDTTDADRTIQQQQTARTVAADVAKVKEKQCKDAQDRYEKAIQARRLYKTTKDGQREYMSDAEANEIRVQAKNDVDLACGPAK